MSDEFAKGYMQGNYVTKNFPYNLPIISDMERFSINNFHQTIPFTGDPRLTAGYDKGVADMTLALKNKPRQGEKMTAQELMQKLAPQTVNRREGYNGPFVTNNSFNDMSMKESEINRKAMYNNINRLPIPMNENNMPMFNTDADYMQYLQEYDPEMFMQMQNKYYNTKGTMGEGKINPMEFIKGLLGG